MNSMHLTPKAKLTKGIWFARQRSQPSGFTLYPWCIVTLTGEFPFLHGRVSIYDVEITSPQAERILRNRDYPEIENPDQWEFGSKIEFPSVNALLVVDKDETDE